MTRGDVYRVRLPSARGYEQPRPRYAVILQAEALLALSTTLVAPTSQTAAAATFRPQVQVVGSSTRVLVEQLRAVDLQRLDKHVGRVTPEEQRGIDQALELVLGL